MNVLPPRRLVRLSALLATCLGLVLAGASTASAQCFSNSSFWNAPLASDAPLDARSTVWAEHMAAKVKQYGSWINTTSYSTPVYTVPAKQPLVKVKIDWPSAQYDAEFESGVPVPVGLVPAAGTDMHVAIWQPSTDTLWEFWQMRIAGDGLWHANTAGKIKNVSTDDGLFAPHPYDQPYGATASELPLTPGLITPEELKTGVIKHALTVAIPHPLHCFWWTWPATRSDGDSFDWYDVPEGARFRLPANLDLTKLGLTRTGLIIARAVQKYGLVINDRSTTVHFDAQDPVNLGGDPYPALFGGLSPSSALYNFPWSSLRALASQPNQPWPS
jgi:hypothetical protein